MGGSLLALVSVFLSACGGGGGDTSTTAETPTVAAVTSAQAAAVKAGKTLVVMVQGEHLDLGISATSTGCTAAPVLSTSAPYASSATTAYFTCTATAQGSQTLTVKRTADSATLKTVSYTIDPLVPTVTSMVADTPKYGQPLLLTVWGADLDTAGGLSVSAPNCNSLTQSTQAPYVSSASVAYFQCTPKTLGAQTASVTRVADSSSLASVSYTVPAPQVTLALTNNQGISGNVVLTLAPDKTPVTVDNFLGYVKAGFYDGLVFHRYASNFVLQGGGYASPVVASTIPTHKTTGNAIALEVGKGLSNTQWTLAMARGTALNTATSEFFINLVNNSFLDTSGGGYAVFGSITSGTEVISQLTASFNTSTCVQMSSFVWSSLGCVPIPNVVITSATQSR